MWAFILNFGFHLAFLFVTMEHILKSSSYHDLWFIFISIGHYQVGD